MKKLYTLLYILIGVLTTVSAQKLTPNEQQARRLFDEAYNMVYGPKGSQLSYSVNIIGIYKTKGTIWTMGKMSKFADEKYIAWNDDVTYYRYERKKNTVTIYSAHDDERDKYATKFKFYPENYGYHIKDDKKGNTIMTYSMIGRNMNASVSITIYSGSDQAVADIYPTLGYGRISLRGRLVPYRNDNISINP